MVGHQWSRYGPEPGDAPPKRGYVIAHYICDRCGTTKRYNVHKASGEYFGPYYRNRPSDYKTVTMTQAEWRIMLLNKEG